ncbi:CBS domain-containing protein [Methanocella sp. MCL-LM]|uniref:CBS domain-containing protein n=1 Tax=Methanocella sp. MCL-LM TaxID=3412035 RepID=UPI003C76ABA1
MTSVDEIMSAPVFAVSARDNLARARNLMLRNDVSRLVVVDEGRLLGIVTKKDLGMRLNQSEPQWRRRPLDQVPVDLIMTPDPITVEPSGEVQAVAQTMLDRDVSSLVVYNSKDGVLGIVTKHDLVRYFTLVGCPLRVGDMMSGKPAVVSRLHTINSVIDVMTENNTDRVVVTDADNEKNASGMITLDDLGFVEINPRTGKSFKEARKESIGGPKRYRAYVKLPMVAEDVMASPLVTVQRKTMAQDAARIMEESNFDMLPVVDGEIVGQFNYENILKWLSEGQE